MQCTNPMFLKSQGFYVPCGKCLGCKIAHSREWTVRLMHEMSSWDCYCFLTLTYDEEHVPFSLSKRELQLFWKRLRKAIHPRKLKYFSCGEYGDTYGRPHYHAIVYGVDWNDEKIILKCWNKGFIKIGGVTRKSIGYVTDYCLKKYDKRRNKDEYERFGLETPFQLASQGFGLKFAVANRQQLSDDLGCTYNGRRVGLPKYYVRKLDIDTDIMREFAKNGEKEKLTKICRSLGKSYDEFMRCSWNSPAMSFGKSYMQAYRQELQKQLEINYSAKKRFKKGNF